MNWKAKGKWIKITRRQSMIRCEAAGCQNFIDDWDWYWRDEFIGPMCLLCAWRHDVRGYGGRCPSHLLNLATGKA